MVEWLLHCCKKDLNHFCATWKKMPYMLYVHDSQTITEVDDAYELAPDDDQACLFWVDRSPRRQSGVCTTDDGCGNVDITTNWAAHQNTRDNEFGRNNHDVQMLVTSFAVGGFVVTKAVYTRTNDLRTFTINIFTDQGPLQSREPWSQLQVWVNWYSHALCNCSWEGWFC